MITLITLLRHRSQLVCRTSQASATSSCLRLEPAPVHANDARPRPCPGQTLCRLLSAVARCFVHSYEADQGLPWTPCRMCTTRLRTICQTAGMGICLLVLGRGSTSHAIPLSRQGHAQRIRQALHCAPVIVLCPAQGCTLPDALRYISNTNANGGCSCASSWSSTLARR